MEIKCLRGQNEDAEKKAYELRQQLDELKGNFVRICTRSVKRHTVKMEVLMCTSMHSQPKHFIKEGGLQELSGLIIWKSNTSSSDV